MSLLQRHARRRPEPGPRHFTSRTASGLNIELSDAQRILADEKARREAAFEQSFNTERTKGDALSKRFEEALKQAKDEPITKPTRDFDLD